MSDQTDNVVKDTGLKQIPDESSAPVVLFLEFELPATKTTLRVNKLKAKAYYEAQKVYVDWVKELQTISTIGINQQNVLDAEGKVDMSKYAAEEKKAADEKVTAVLEKSDSVNTKRIHLISLCLDTPVEKLETDYYPEDLDVILGKCIEVNQFMNNLKKSVAPTAGIGV